MKKFLFFIAFTISAVCAYSQNDLIVDSSTLEQASIVIQSQTQASLLPINDTYKNTPEWGKYKALRAVGWTTFGIGIATTATGTLLWI